MSEPAIIYIAPPVPDERVIAYRLVGSVRTEEMKELMARIAAVVENGHKVRLYQELAGFDGFEFGVLVEKIKASKTLWGGIEKIAVVSGSKAYRFGVGKIADPLTPMDMHAFKPEEREAAFAWLQSDPA